MLKMTTNKIISNPDYAAIDSTFDIFKISTDEKYISSGASYLDNLEKGAVLSIVFEKGNSFFVLTKKYTITTTALITLLRSFEKGNHLSIAIISSKNVPSNNLVQLFFNAIGYDETGYFSFNNLTGKLLCYNKNWQSVNRKTGKIWGLQCLEVKIEKDMTIHFIAHKLTSVLLKDEMIFQKRKFPEYPQYKIAFVNNTLKRVPKEELNKEENFIIKPLSDEKGFVSFFDFSDYAKFESSKLGCFYNLFTVFKKKYGSFFDISFEQMDISQSLELKRNELNQYKKIVENIILEKGLNLTDCTGFSTAKQYLQDVADEIGSLFPGAKCSVRDFLSKSKLNIRYIKDKSCYEDTEDPHQDKLDGFVIQHITTNYSYDSKSATFNILKELAIKNDIKERMVSLIDWSSFNFDSDWIFGIKKETKFVFLTIHPDGSFEFEEMEADLFNLNEYSKYMELMDQDDVVGIIKNHLGDINLIKDTNLFSMPDFSSTGDILKEVEKPKSFTGNELKELFPEYEDCFEYRDYSKQDILHIFEKKKEKDDIERVLQDRGILLYAHLRGKEQRKNYFSGVVDINFTKVNEHEGFYTVGEVGNGMRNNIQRASIIRKIEAPEGNSLFFQELLPLMGIEFVRYGMLTVVPFPFKYLREYIKTNEM